MNTSDFYRLVVPDEITCMNYLLERNVFSLPATCSKMNSDGKICGGNLMIYTKNYRERDSTSIYMRCRKSNCQKTQSVRKDNDFFAFQHNIGKRSGKLTLCQIVDMIWHWLIRSQVSEIQKRPNMPRGVFIRWKNHFRNVCVLAYNARSCMGGAGSTVQITETLFNRYNTTGHWVLCFVCTKNDITEKRFFIVEKRDKDIIMPIVINEIQPGTNIITNDGRHYSGISNYDFNHLVIATNNVVNTETGEEIVSLELLWHSIRLYYFIRSPNETYNNERQLMEIWWRFVNPNDKFEAYLRTLKSHLFHFQRFSRRLR